MDERALKQCPFCGGEAKIMNLNHGTWVECSNYHYEHHQVCVHAKTEAEAIAAWNTRAELGSGTCEIETSWEIRDELGIVDAPEDTWGYRCSACGWSFRYDRGIEPNFCPNCGRKVVSA